jgi:hypothetical protein
MYQRDGLTASRAEPADYSQMPVTQAAAPQAQGQRSLRSEPLLPRDEQ